MVFDTIIGSKPHVKSLGGVASLIPISRSRTRIVTVSSFEGVSRPGRVRQRGPG